MPRVAALPPLALVLALVALGGCVSVGDPASPTAPATPTDDTLTPTPTDGTPTPTPTDGTPIPTPTSGEAPTGVVLEYANLTDEQQAAVRAAVDGGARFVPNTSYVDEAGFDIQQAGPFRRADWVHYDGTYYAVEMQDGRLYASYGIRATPATPEGNASVTPFASVPDEYRDELRTALESGRYFAPAGKWDSLPEPFSDTRYVRYQNRTYRMEYVVGDTWAVVMTLRARG